MPKRKSGDQPEAAKRRRAQLEKSLRDMEDRIQEIRKELGEMDSVIVDAKRGQAQANGTAQATSSPRRSLRAKALDALADLGFMTYTRQLAPLIEALDGGRAPAARFGVLARDEERSFRSSRPRPVYLCFALTARGEPIKRLWARSDWPLEERVVAPTTGRVQHLTITARLCELVLKREHRAADPARLKYLAADHARDLPGVRVRRGKFELEEWVALARDELSRFVDRDVEERQQIAARLQARPAHAQLFGVEFLEGDAEVPKRRRAR